MRLDSRVAVVGALVALVACGTSTKLTATWKAPDAQAVRFRKVLVAAQTREQATRRSLESHMVSRIANSQASYEVLTEDETRDAARAKVKIAAAGFDGAVVVRYVSSERQQTYVPGTTWWGPAPYGSFYGYWGYGWGAVYDPGYLRTDTVISLESHVYDIAQDKLLWASMSETVNPQSMQDLVNSLFDKTVAEMKRQKVIG